MAYSKAQKNKLYVKYKTNERLGNIELALMLKNLYRCMVLNISSSILIKI